ncbi:MAG: DUF2199 domain-containing protein [Flavobacterium psychrophilum]|nr:MAG: DUF2199 domain-containing protein [Flavobacterium psychrophilum]
MLKKLKGLFTSKSVDPKFVCSCCGKEHSEWPSLGYNAPVYYSILSDDAKNEIAELSSDFCVIRHNDQTDRFIRVVLKMPVHGHCRDMEYGLWVSLSEKSFEDYQDNYNDKNREGGYFGWTSNNLEGYENTLSIPVDVYLQPNGFRPLIVPHQSHDHPLVYDYYNGIPLVEAEKRINCVIQKSAN